jgi:ABC-type Fe3+/spermidine/putrescine transport system ATPase subunit
MPEAALELRGLTKHFGASVTVGPIDLIVRQGEFVTLLGPSGCGKTTTLNMIGGFVTPDAGGIHLAGSPVETLPPWRRDLGIVFQDYALFPHRTVAENIGFGLRMRRVGRAEIARRVYEAMQLVRLDGLGDRRPGQLSGGQRQRVALARALVIRPSLLLLDEPLSNLDLKLREEMRIEISTLQRRLGIAALFVTHDQEEALTMSDRIAVMRGGRIEQLGSAREIYEAPASAFVAGFIGSTNLIRGSVIAPRQPGGTVRVDTGAGPAMIPIVGDLPDGGAVLLMIRPERLKLASPGAAPEGTNAWSAQVVRTIYLGGRMEVRLRLRDGGTAIAYAVNEGETDWDEGEMVDAWFRPRDAWVIPGPAEDSDAQATNCLR